MKLGSRIILFVLLPLFTGGLIYIFCRPQTIRFKTWFGESTADASVIRELLKNLPDWMVYNLPAGLWLFAFLHGLQLLRSPFWFYVLAVLFAIGAEVMQATHFTSGTFDFQDLLAYLLAMVVFIGQQQIQVVKTVAA